MRRAHEGGNMCHILAGTHEQVFDIEARPTDWGQQMRFAFSTSPQRTTWPWLLELWQRADQHPVLESGWTFDHFYPLFGDSTEDCMEGWITLTALLQATTRVRGGVLVTGMLYRHPAVLANMASTLDITSGGRLELGVGAGWNEEECAAFGFDLGTMTERFDRFEEGMAVLHGLLTQDRTSIDGRYYKLVEAMNNPKGPQDPLPICIGGIGLKRTLPMAARYAHHWNYAGSDVDDFRRRYDVFAGLCAEQGRDVADVTVSVLVRLERDFDKMLADADAYGATGANLAIVSIPKSAPPSIIDDVARAATAAATTT